MAGQLSPPPRDGRRSRPAGHGEGPEGGRKEAGFAYENVAEVLAHGLDPHDRRSAFRSSGRFARGAGRKLRGGAYLLHRLESPQYRPARLANERGWKLNEYGLFAGKPPDRRRNRRRRLRETGIIAFIPPELREDRGEVAAAKENVCRIWWRSTTSRRPACSYQLDRWYRLDRRDGRSRPAARLRIYRHHRSQPARDHGPWA